MHIYTMAIKIAMIASAAVITMVVLPTPPVLKTMKYLCTTVPNAWA